jgi:nucleotide-binding universal stress UspA family protein
MNATTGVPMLQSPHSLVDSSRRTGKPHADEHAPKRPAAVREIVACLDGSTLGSSIIPHARAVANAFGARLTLLHVLEIEAGVAAPLSPLDWGIRQREARAHLEEMVSRLGDVESGVASELIQGRAAEQICSWAEKHDVDLTVLCSHGSHGVTDWQLASTARKLIERTPGSLLLVPATATREEPVRYRRILVPLDGSPRGESVLPIAMRIAQSQQADILLVHVVPPPDITHIGPVDAEGADLMRKVSAHNHRVADAYLDRIRARVSQSGCPVRALVVDGGSVRTQLERAIREEGADLVVMSAQGRTTGLDMPCGSVTEHTMAHSSAPVLVVRDGLRRRMRRADPSSDEPLRDRLATTGHIDV